MASRYFFDSDVSPSRQTDQAYNFQTRGDVLAATQRYVDENVEKNRTEQLSQNNIPSPSKNKYNFSRAADNSSVHSENHVSQRSNGKLASGTASVHTKQPTLQEVQEKLKAIEMEQRAEARRRLEASAHRSAQAALALQRQAEEAASEARYQQASDFAAYSGSIQRVSARPIPHEATAMAAIGAFGRQRFVGAQEYDAAHGRHWDSSLSHSRSASPEQRWGEPMQDSRGARRRAASNGPVQDDPLLPVGKRIDPHDVVYKPVRGKLGAMLSNRNNVHDVESFSRFHPTPATAVAGGRHDGIVASAAPPVPGPLARSASLQRSSSSGGARGAPRSSIEAYTREVEAAQVRRLKGQAAIISAHQHGDSRMIHYDPLLSVRPVEWRQRDVSTLHGPVPRATVLRMQHTEKKIRALGQSNAKGGGSSRVSLSSSVSAASHRRHSSIGPSFGPPLSAFTAHPLGFSDLPVRKKGSPARGSPATSAPPSPDRAGASLPQPSSPRYVLPAAVSSNLVATPNIPSGNIAAHQGHCDASPPPPCPPPAFTVESASVANTSNLSESSGTARMEAPSSALVKGKTPGPNFAVPNAPLRPFSDADLDLPRRSKKSLEGRGEREGSGGEKENEHGPPVKEKDSSTSRGGSEAGGGSPNALVEQLLEKQAQQQAQIERLLKVQEALLQQQQNQQQQQHAKSPLSQPQPLPQPANRYNYYERAALASASVSPATPEAGAGYGQRYASAVSASPSPPTAAAPPSFVDVPIPTYVPNPKYVSPSRPLVLGGDSPQYAYEGPVAATTRIEPHDPLVAGIGGATRSSVPRAASLPGSQPSAAPPQHPWWDRRSPDANPPPPMPRDRTSSPNNNQIAAAFAFAAATTPVGGRRPPEGDEVLSTALSPLSEEGRTPSPAPPPARVAPEPEPRPNTTSVPIPVPIPRPVFVHENFKTQNVLPSAPSQSQPFSNQRPHSVGSVAQLFRSARTGPNADNGPHVAFQGPPSLPQPIRSDLFRPSASRDRSGSSGGHGNAFGQMSFREAFDSGAHLPHELPTGGLSPEQQVAYYAKDDDEPTPTPSDPATLLLMQMAGQHALAMR